MRVKLNKWVIVQCAKILTTQAIVVRFVFLLCCPEGRFVCTRRGRVAACRRGYDSAATAACNRVRLVSRNLEQTELANILESRLFKVPSVLWHCWLGVRKNNRSVKIEWWGVGVIICLERGADCLHMVRLMPPPSQNPIISCLSDWFYLSGTGLPRLSWKRGR